MLFSCMGWMVMSNAGTYNKTQRIIDAVTEVWKLPDRDDLLNDCIDYVAKNYTHSYTIHHLVIEFLSNKCADAMSTADLKSMAFDEETEKEKWHEHLYKLQYEDVTQGS